MEIFKLFGSILVDSSQAEQSIQKTDSKAKGFASTLGNGLKTVGKAAAGIASAAAQTVKTVGLAIGAASASVTAFAKSSIDVGMTFDSSMSQVAATMGTTIDKIQDLRDFAQEMGSKTAFSASQAADALNYMALAGYDAETSMAMLPNVLNLAAAGGIELASASDMITDSQSALGLSLEETSTLVDQMAKASSKSNTSVAQLGEAILTVGGTAKNLAGGTTELSTALGILADNGVKGAEGGTALRNIILSLSAPTKKAAGTLADLGVEVFDAAGNMRPLNETFRDLDKALSTMTQGEQTQTLNRIFNKVDLKSVNALLANTNERFDELSGYIDDAAGAAEAMANTQLDNLAGDITLFKSALEGAQIAVSDQLTPTLREFVQFGAQGISKVTDAFKEGGLSGAMRAFGGILSDGISMITDMLPTIVDAGVELLDSIITGLADNIEPLTNAALKIGSKLIEGFGRIVPKIAPAALKAIKSLASSIAKEAKSGDFSSLFGKFLGIFAESIEKIANLIEVTAEPIRNIATEIFTAFIQALNKIMPVAVKIIEKLLPPLLDILEALMPLLDVIMSFLDPIFDYISALIEPIAKILNDLIKPLVTVLVKLTEKILGPLSDKVGEFAPLLGDILGGALMAISDLISDVLIPAFDGIIKFLDGDFIGGLESWGGIFTGFFDKLFEGIDKMFGTHIAEWYDEFKGFMFDISADLYEMTHGDEIQMNELHSKYNTMQGDIYDAIKAGVAAGKTAEEALKDAENSLLDTQEKNYFYSQMKDSWDTAGVAQGYYEGKDKWLNSYLNDQTYGDEDERRRRRNDLEAAAHVGRPPRLASGGIATGSTLAMVGDNPDVRVNPEVIAPLSDLSDMIFTGFSRALDRYAESRWEERSAPARQSLTVIVQLADGTELTRAIIDNINEIARQDGKSPLKGI